MVSLYLNLIWLASNNPRQRWPSTNPKLNKSTLAISDCILQKSLSKLKKWIVEDDHWLTWIILRWNFTIKWHHKMFVSQIDLNVLGINWLSAGVFGAQNVYKARRWLVWDKNNIRTGAICGCMHTMACNTYQNCSYYEPKCICVKCLADFRAYWLTHAPSTCEHFSYIP